jgi:uncharacterized protein (DUF302 family)
MSRLRYIIAVIAIIPGISWAADGRLVIKKSPHSVAVTLDRLSELLRARGIGIAARVDRAAAAQKAGQALKPTQLLIFGDPRLGTPLMQTNPKIGLDLPMKVLAWEDDSGQVWIAYVRPASLKTEHAISGHDSTFERMAQGLEKLTNEALAAN